MRSGVEGITHPYLNVGLIQGGTNTNVIPGKVVIKLDRRMIPEEDPAEVEAALRRTIAEAAARYQPPRGGRAISVDVKRILLARALKPLPGNKPRWSRPFRNTAASCSANPFPPSARRSIPTCASTASTASRA